MPELSAEIAQILEATGIGLIDALVILGWTALIGRLFKNQAVRDFALPFVCIVVANVVLWGSDVVPLAYEKFAKATVFGGALTGLYPWFGGALTSMRKALKPAA
jgi:hypothetical protein